MTAPLDPLTREMQKLRREIADRETRRDVLTVEIQQRLKSLTALQNKLVEGPPVVPTETEILSKQIETIMSELGEAREAHNVDKVIELQAALKATIAALNKAKGIPAGIPQNQG